MRVLSLVTAVGFFALLLLVVGIRRQDVPEGGAYVGSGECTGCHRAAHESWSAGLHNQMMRLVTEPGVVVADLEAEDLPFHAEDAVWAIGGKWEQQFMGHEDGVETLLPGAWEVDNGRWRRVGWDGWQVPEPVRRCHGCHTVGLDPETGSFVEPNIGCESCHGRGEWHRSTLGLGRIESSADPQVCGQCHDRGRSPDGALFYPHGYEPGGDLSAHFVPQAPSLGQNSTNWWGNGRERKRHQQYSAWSRGGHADSLDSLVHGYDGRYGEVEASCLECHAAEGVLAPRAVSDVDDAQWGVTCQVCHNVHGELDEIRTDCADCHREGAFQHEPERNRDHVPCPDAAAVDCVDCHMPLTIENGGGYTMRSHAPGIVHPQDTIDYGVPNACSSGGCHAEASPSKLVRTFDGHYKSVDSERADKLVE